MRLRNFYVFMKNNFENNEVLLNNTSLVIDGHSLLHRINEGSIICSRFGCECDSYLNYAKKELEKLKKAHVKCYVLFRGGDDANHPRLYKPPLNEYEREVMRNVYEPLLAREVFKEALNDLGLDYAICEYTNKRECVALARRLNSAVLSFDINFYFFGVDYIPYVTLHFDPFDNTLRGKLLRLDDLMTKFQLDSRQIAFFITLFNENDVLSKEFQDNLLRKLKLPLSYRQRYKSFLSWLSKNGTSAPEMVSKHVNDDEYNVIRSELKLNTETILKLQEPGRLVTEYFIDINSCAFNRCDKDWFAKGVLWKFIDIPFINVYRYGILKGSWSVEDLDAEDSILLSSPVVRYAFDLLTNFNNSDLLYIGRSNGIDNDECKQMTDGTIRVISTICKPDYGPSNVFENGWRDVRTHHLFEHFLRESIQVEMSALQNAPSDCRLLVAALVYFARRKCVGVDSEVYAVLLSYIMLGVVNQAGGRDGTLDESHCEIAKTVVEKYFTDEEAITKLDRKLLHSLVEFQHCLRHIVFLNTLCGSSLAPVVFSKTFNATFVYLVLYDIKREYNGDGNNFLEDKLERATSVLSFVKELFNVYLEIKQQTI